MQRRKMHFKNYTLLYPYNNNYTVFHKIGTPLYFFNNILPCGPISIIDIPNCSAENRLAICDTFTYLQDYKIWGVLQERVYKTSIKDVDELRRRIAEEWDKLEQRIIDKAIGEWRKRLRACVAAGGGQFEHKMWTFIISDLLYRNFQTQLFEILLFCLVKTGCFVEYNACYILHFVTAIILRYTKNIYKIRNSKPQIS